MIICEHDFCYDAQLQNPSNLLAKAGNRVYQKVCRECRKCQSQLLRVKLPFYGQM